MPARKPTKLRELEGNRSKRALPEEPEAIPVGKTSVPAWYPKSSKAFYARYAGPIREMSGAGETDEPKLLAMALSYGMAMDAAQLAAEEGVIEKDENGVRRKHAALQVYRDNILIFDRLAGQFGLSPAERAKLFSVDANPKDKDSDDDGVLNGQWKYKEDPLRLQ
jgi:P27 family predicted phage terminase small subunit